VRGLRSIERRRRFLRHRKSLRKIADARETLVYGPPMDITNRAHMIKKAAELCNNNITTVVFRGVDRHYNFVHRPDTSVLTQVDVFDVAPPWPAWLAYNIQRQDEAGMYGELMFDFKYRVTDLKGLEDPGRTTISRAGPPAWRACSSTRSTRSPRAT